MKNNFIKLHCKEVEGELYEIMGIHQSILEDEKKLRELEFEMNSHDKREGYDIYPLKNSLGHYVWYHAPKKLVLCLARGLWG